MGFQLRVDGESRSRIESHLASQASGVYRLNMEPYGNCYEVSAGQRVVVGSGN